MVGQKECLGLASSNPLTTISVELQKKRSTANNTVSPLCTGPVRNSEAAMITSYLINLIASAARTFYNHNPPLQPSGTISHIRSKPLPQPRKNLLRRNRLSPMRQIPIHQFCRIHLSAPSAYAGCKHPFPYCVPRDGMASLLLI